MKRFLLNSTAVLALVGSAIVLTGCSQCYECTEEVVLYDNNDNPIDTTETAEDFCTADQSEVTAREDEGAICKVQ